MRFIPYGRQFIDKKDAAEVVKALRSDFVTQGPKVAEFERSLAGYCGAKYAVALSSGTAALHIACLAAGLNPGDEAITAPLTFAATANSILYTGAKPVFADIDPETGNIDAAEIIKKITKKTKAILPVHFAGLPCDVTKIAKIARKRSVIVIEDACHALGAQYKYKERWVRIGSCLHSDMAIFSFHPVKSITTGEGGAILTNRKDIYDKLVILRNHGITKDNSKFTNKNIKNMAWYYEMVSLGFNYRITDIQCALGMSQLRKLEMFIRRRREIAGIYNKEFSNMSRIQLPPDEKSSRSAWHLYYIRVNNRANVFRTLQKNGLGVQVHYIPVYFHPYYRELGYKKGICPNAEDFYKKTISIPIYYSMSNEDIKYVVQSVKKALNT